MTKILSIKEGIIIFPLLNKFPLILTNPCLGSIIPTYLGNLILYCINFSGPLKMISISLISVKIELKL